MRTRLFRALTAAAFAILPFAAIGADDKTPMPCTPASAVAPSCPAASYPRTTSQAPAAPQAPVQDPRFAQPPGNDIDPGFSPRMQYPSPYVVPQAIPPAQPTLEEMVAEWQTLRDKEKKLREAIREKIKAQRKATDDAEHILNGEARDGNRLNSPPVNFPDPGPKPYR